MDEDKGDDNMVIGSDFNREPSLNPPPQSPSLSAPLSPSLSAPLSPSLLDEMETSQVGIVDRIRQLQAVTARANQSQRWRRLMNNPKSTLEIKPIVDARNKNQSDIRVVEGPMNSGGGGGEKRVRNCKRDVTHLAKALEMDLDSEKTDNGNFFNCNICIDMAKDPILTCCGHLFCSSCFDQVPYVDSISKECPVCDGEVIDSNITPINGNGKNSHWF